jgi:hypothetical protein
LYIKKSLYLYNIKQKHLKMDISKFKITNQTLDLMTLSYKDEFYNFTSSVDLMNGDIYCSYFPLDHDELSEMSEEDLERNEYILNKIREFVNFELELEDNDIYLNEVDLDLDYLYNLE